MIDILYKQLVENIINNGEFREDRTGTGVISTFHHSLSIDLKKGFPLLTTKRVYFSGVFDELLWFLSGSTNVNDLPKRTQKWWSPWANQDGSLGPTYGKQYLNQLDDLINGIKTNPNSRRHVITMWNGYDAKNCNLPPCHGTVIQFYINNGKLSCSTYQRSVDTVIGLPVNIASYALLTHLIASTCDLEVDMLHYTLGDTHIYTDHLNAVSEQLVREIRPSPKLEIINKKPDIRQYTLDDVILKEYNPHPAIKLNVSV